MKQVVFLFFVFILIVGCKETIVDKPENILDKDVMTNIYYDIAVLNAAKSTAAKNLETYNFDPEEYIYRKYNIDSAQLSQNSIYYTSNPNLQSEMFTEVEKRLQKLKDTVDSKLEKQQTEKVKKAPAKKAPAKKAPVKKTK
ncbi:DUF4296 domain-containing protein [Joostella sp. CR20]|uniref:DUF4296 domain-containing protein n=1 Tax=Joostella sp. CR20 TaxID=2804312 RepID=UPI00313C0ABE